MSLIIKVDIRFPEPTVETSARKDIECPLRLCPNMLAIV
jgi:hypothetical protein